MQARANRLTILCGAAAMMLMVAMACVGCGSQEKNSIEYSKVRYVRQDDGRDLGAYSIGFLKADTGIDGRIYKGWLHLRENGIVCGGLLAKDVLINGILVPADTWVSFDAEGRLERCHFPHDMTIDGYDCIGTGGGLVGAAVTFHENGRLSRFYSPRTVVIQGMSCRGGLFAAIGLYPDGRLKSCTLDDSTVIGGRIITAGTVIELDASGQLISGTS